MALSNTVSDAGCINLSHGIPFDLADIYNVIINEVDTSGLLDLLEPVAQGAGVDPFVVPCNVTVDLNVLDHDLATITLGDFAIGGWANIDNIGELTMDEANVAFGGLEMGGPIWLNASTAILGGLTPLQFLDLAIGAGIHLGDLGLAFDLDLCLDSEVFSFEGILGMVIQTLSQPEDQRMDYLLGAIKAGITTFEFGTLDIDIDVAGFYIENEKNGKEMDIELPEKTQEEITKLVEMLGNSLVKTELNKLLANIFSSPAALLNNELIGDASDMFNVQCNF